MSIMSLSSKKYGRIWHIAYPILISVMMEQIVGITDTAFLGRVGEIELGASALGGIFYISIFVIGMGFCQGTQILMGRRNGEQNFSQIGEIFYHSLIFLFLLGLLIFCFVLFCTPTILKAIIVTPEMCKATQLYLQWRIYGIFFAYVAIMFRSFYVATTNTRMLTLNSFVMVGCNILFDYLLIFGKMGFPVMGIAGAAIASALSEFVSMAFFIVYTKCRINIVKYALHHLPRFRLNLLRHILNISIWTMVQDFISVATWFFFFLAVEHLGDRQLAVSNIVRNISSVTYMTVSALAVTASTLVSNLMGEKQIREVLPTIGTTVKLGFFILIPICLVAAVFPEWVIRIFTNNYELVRAGCAPLWVMLSSYVVTVPAQIIFKAISGTGNTRIALLVEVISLISYMTYIYVVVFNLRMNLAWCWGAEYFYQGTVLLCCIVYLKRGSWQSKRI
jgi:MATE family multidrug resistance protein